MGHQLNERDLEPLVLVLDEDRAARAALEKLLRSAGYTVVTLSSPEELFQRLPVNAPACLVLDVALHGTDGFELQRELSERGYILPILFITAQADIAMSVRAMKAGAVSFLSKPCLDEELLSGIRQGLDEASCRWTSRRELLTLREHYGLLTLRERQVFELVASGLPNKGVASALSIAEATVKIHRGQVMHKMHAGSLAELVRMASRMSLPMGGTDKALTTKVG